MFVSILVSTHRAGQKDTVIEDFKAISESIRDLQLIMDRSRDIEFVFKTDNIKPFLEFAKEITINRDYVKHNIEFAYDDGNYYSYSISDGDVMVLETGIDNLIGSRIFLEHVTGVSDNFDKLVEIWTDENSAGLEERVRKKEDLATAKRLWDEKFERDMERIEARKKRKEEQEKEGKTTVV